MNIAIIGASGRVGSRLAKELITRGHKVTGIARDASKVEPQTGLTAKSADATQSKQLSTALAGHDAVVSAANFRSSDVNALLTAAKNSHVPRVLVVGGAGSLEIAPGKALIDTPEFPEAYKPEAGAGRDFLNSLKREQSIDWTFLSPSAEFLPGERTGKFRVGGDQLLSDANGRSWISMEDYAIALADEIENPQHSRKRFTVGY
ncbi:MAG: NAD(P)-dependent oxidoreductase [Pseudomonadota bacterium]